MRRIDARQGLPACWPMPTCSYRCQPYFHRVPQGLQAVDIFHISYYIIYTILYIFAAIQQTDYLAGVSLAHLVPATLQLVAHSHTVHCNKADC
jgi:hypothetical protein